jgi:hypothetical protein
MLHLVLRDGYRGHAVVVTVNDRIVYQASDVTTNPATGRAGAVDVAAAHPAARLTVAVSPDGLTSAIDVDLDTHPHVAISLVGSGTLAFETSSIPFS